MTLTRKILLLVAGIVTLFLVLNLTILPMVTKRYFFDFLEQFYTETKKNEIDAEILGLIKQFPDNALELLEQYTDIDNDLGLLASGLEKYIDSNPQFNRDSVGKYLENSGVEQQQVEDVIGLNALSAFLKEAPLGFSFTE